MATISRSIPVQIPSQGFRGQQQSYSYGAQPVAAGTSPTKRKSNSWTPQRDSLKRREKIGKPGSRRHQRWMNRVFLMEQEAELELEDFTVLDPAIPRTALSQIFEDSLFHEIWAPFVDITEEQEEKLLMSLDFTLTHKTDKYKREVGVSFDEEEDEDEENEEKMFPAHESFKRIDKKIRKVLQQQIENEFLSSMDKEIASYIQIKEFNTLTYSFEDSFHRLICHGICQFYSLRSRSEDSDTGDRILVIKKPTTLLKPSTTLTEFLQKKASVCQSS
eukprot:CAMPEP_0168560182 /NCGR_PEP_ID=MMETSP0413-20121227/10922_1 /TAXON_ID=136452 /ORGANISM="Filamoeba nolandi, Strain NC-AS-23-1" /LENGTH=274 /DNA_ID=CAMNT_0008591463 /DNA_START=187 /DNA_END=1011 /DNA_ORIENTATION=+